MSTSRDVTRPLTIVVAGSSVSVSVSPPRRDRHDRTYGELLTETLDARGVRASVVHTGKWFDMVNELRRRYEPAIRNHFPDVLVLNYGFVESQPNFLPTWASRHFTTWDVSSAPVAAWYRRHIAPRVWRVLRAYQRRAASMTSRGSYRLSPKRFAAELRRVIELSRLETGCLVLVLDIDPPDGRVLHWMPGMRQRWERYQAVLRHLVAEIGDPDVRLVPASRVVDELELSAALPDGIHRSPAAHRHTAELLTDEIVTWLHRG
ncbi:MAG TPA: SGNH/GDSL hydrolase family protein [Mycobacteriales bacterium]|nr:SGNH/GDSL hydrolase family protein [Mycobacteriales bacterium]